MKTRLENLSTRFWNVINDTLTVPGPSIIDANFVFGPTERYYKSFLRCSTLLVIFPLLVLDAKLFMKTLLIDKSEWDVKFNEKQLEMWLQVIEALRDIPTCHIPGITHEGTGTVLFVFVMLKQRHMPQLFTFIKRFQTYAM